MERRDFLKKTTLATAATALTTAINSQPAKAGTDLFESFFQKHYKEMTDEDKKKVFARLERNIKENYHKEVTVKDPKVKENTHWAYFLNLSKCNGNRKCVEACVKENNLNRGGEYPINYIKVLEMDLDSMNLEKGNLYYEGQVPKPGKFYLPVQCNQCNNPPCVKACPVEATWKERDGIVVVDYDWCIGCRYCQAACPYEARHFNFEKPQIPAEEINPNQNYLSNRIRPKGVMEKCTFCLHRTREGLNPACMDACPTGARHFGNLMDKDSEVSQILRTKKVFVLKEELNTLPQFFYFFG